MGISEKWQLSEFRQTIAIVGVALRFPGDLSDLPSFWKALMEGADLVTEIDASRWAVKGLDHPKRSEPGRSITFSAGVLSRIDEFDAGFFGISPREAELLDPQQRLLLELTWEALENAKVKPSTLAGSDCGVFVGISGLDYGMRLLDDLPSMAAHSMTGNTLSIAANRLSYTFDLRGPSMAIDTACSSSLVALHQACAALASGQTSMALVGGVNLLLHPYPFVGFTKASMLSAQGRCRAFADGGDGYVRAEGAAMLLLKPMHQAEQDGDLIWGVICASGVNSDGARKSGLTIPSADAQAELMQQVLHSARLMPEGIDYIEAHGTGTRIGDPIEARAISRAYGASGNRSQPLPIGSVKSNLGHMEPASGMGGLLKALLTLQHRTVPPSIHAEKLNPNIDFDALHLRVAREPVALHAQDRPLRVGINSFGFGGVNAHVILEEHRPEVQSIISARTAQPSTRPTAQTLGETPLPLVLSAKDDAALRELAARYLPLLTDADTTIRERIAQAVWQGRDWLDVRMALPDLHAPNALDTLRLFAEGENPPEILQVNAVTEVGKLAFVYNGNGAQWVGMGRKLIETSAVFRHALEQATAAVTRHGGPDVLQVLASDDPADMADTALAQPALFAIQVAMTELLRSLGISSNGACGHSVGEIAAAWAVGALDLDAAARVIVARSKAQALTYGTGRMAAVGLGVDAMRETLVRLNLEDKLEVAAINSPRSVTVSGSKAALDVLRDALFPQSTFYRELDLDYAFHSRLMDPIREGLVEGLTDLCCAPTTDSTFYSTVTGAPHAVQALDADYWWRNVREPVQFGPTISRMAADGYGVFLEIGPNAILRRYIDEALQADKDVGHTVATARRNTDDLPTIVGAALRIALLGIPVNASSYFHADDTWRQVQLPNYPWQRTRHWYTNTSESYALMDRHIVHPLLGYRLKELPAAWENHLDTAKLPWLADHKVGQVVILPGAAYLEMALAASREWFQDAPERIVDHLEILSPVVFDGEHANTLRVILNPADGRVRIEGRRRLSQDTWALHARCQVRTGQVAVNPVPPQIPAPPETATTLDGARIYAIASALGLDYGPAFRGLHTLRVASETLQSDLVWPEGSIPAQGYVIHPAVLDQCFQATFGWFEAALATAARPMAFLPVGMEHVAVRQAEAGSLATHLRARLVRRSPRSLLVDFEILDAQCRVLAEVRGVRFRAAALNAQHALPQAWATRAQLVPLEGDPTGAALVPTTSEIAKAIEHGFGDVKLAELKSYAEELAPLVDALPAAFARDALLSLVNPDGMVEAATLARVRESHPLWHWCIALLQEEGVLQSHTDGWQVHAGALPQTDAIWQSALIECPQAWPELLRMARVGEGLLELVSSDENADEPAPDAGALAPDAPWYTAAQQASLQGIRALVQGWPQNRRLRVLEIAVGETILLDALRGELPPERTDIVLARLSEPVLAHLQARLADDIHSFVTRIDPATFALYPVEGMPDRFDLVLLHHTLHSCPAPGAALAELAKRMTTDALLIIADRWPDRASNLLFGAQRDWWHAHDDGPVSSLMTPHNWTQALQEAGWQNVQSVSDPEAGAAGLGSFVLLACSPVQQSRSEPEGLAPQRQVLIVQDPVWQVLAEALVLALVREGQQAEILVHSNLPQVDVFAACDSVIIFPALPAPQAKAQSLATSLDVLRGTLIQAAALENPPQVWLLTQGGALADGPALKNINPEAAALWGMVRVLRNEAPHLSTRLLDVQVPIEGLFAASDMAARISHALLHDDGEDETMLTAQGRFALRVVPIDLGALLPVPVKTVSAKLGTVAPDTEYSAWHLDFTLPGQLRNLHWQASTRRAPQGDEIEIQAVAAGLNFRDLMYAMGLLSDEALEQGFAGAALGLEVAGHVLRCGPNVKGFKPGDDVLAFAGASLASHVVVSERAVALKPPAWSFEQAATVPTVFFTVWYALVHLAHLQTGERVLIHAAAGGVGLAAIQVAKQLGAEVFATAGNADKRTFVRLLGADHVLDSRSPDFDQAILAITGGEGVDVVLNSLAGQAIERNLRSMRAFGRFIELGKRDFYEDTTIGLRPFRNNISYFGFDADQLMALRPDLATRVFGEVMAQFAQGHFNPLAYTAFVADTIVDAFRLMQQGRHIGKLVIDLRQRPQLVQTNKPKPELRLDAHASYLVTGGLTGFGLATAHWLAQQGGCHLVLLGRRGLDTPGLEPALQALREQGTQVTVLACDVTDAAALCAALASLGQSLPPLRGIIHAAMVLDDALLPNLSAARFAQVLTTKLDGARNLHDATQDMALDFFVLYSSATVMLGNPGQANYVAANAALEAFARWRQARGLPALAVAWGPIGDVGVLTTNAAALNALEARLGEAPMKSAQALQALGRLIVSGTNGLAVMPLNASTLRRSLPDASSRRFADLWRMHGSSLDDEVDADLRAHLAQLTPEQAHQTIADMLASEVATILRLPANAVPYTRSLHDLGLDSLMAVELGLALEKRFGVTLPSMLINDNPTVERIAARVFTGLFSEGSSDTPAHVQLVQSMVVQHAETGFDAAQVQALVEHVQDKAQAGTRLIA